MTIEFIVSIRKINPEQKANHLGCNPGCCGCQAWLPLFPCNPGPLHAQKISSVIDHLPMLKGQAGYFPHAVCDHCNCKDVLLHSAEGGVPGHN